jgi:long-chain acyl-CoA synthetase
MVAGDSISYRELELHTRRVASKLAGLGVHKGDRVAILSESLPEWGIASFGIARAGAVAVPLLVDFRAAQVLEILEHSGAKAVFVSARQKAKLDGARAIVLSTEELSTLDAELDHAAAILSLPRVAPDDLVAIVYTSGTTGNPKGVMLTHCNYIADALACSAIIVLRPRDVLLSILPLAHACEYTIGFLIPMMSGSSVRYLDRPPSASVLMPALAAIRPTIMLSVPIVIEKTYRGAVKPALETMKAYRVPLLRPSDEYPSTLVGELQVRGPHGVPRLLPRSRPYRRSIH